MSKHLWLSALLIAGMLVSYSSNGQNIKKFTATPNATGMKLGFWEVFTKMDTTLKYFGKRPTSRVDSETGQYRNRQRGSMCGLAFSITAS